MKLGHAISVRLFYEKEEALRKTAASQGITFGIYLRQLIHNSAALADENAALLAQLEALTFADSEREETVSADQVEALLYLRAIATPAQVRSVHADMARHGLSIWSGDE